MAMEQHDGPTHGLGALDLPHRQKMEILFAILLGLFLGALDQTIVAVALPRIITDLGGQSLYTWTITIYLLASTITVPFYGKLSDLYGRKPLLMIGITIFLVGSALSGLSQNMTQLIISGESRASARAPSSRSASRSSATCSRRRSAASTRASSAPSSASPRSWARSSAAG